MDGRAFLAVARVLAAGGDEPSWRAAVGRAYYALFLECRDTLAAWALRPARGDNVHTFARLRFLYAADPLVKAIGVRLDRWCSKRSKADYDLAPQADFANDQRAREAVQQVEEALVWLDTILADAARVAAITADIRARWP
jgi:hypothetical protein